MKSELTDYLREFVAQGKVSVTCLSSCTKLHVKSTGTYCVIYGIVSCRMGGVVYPLNNWGKIATTFEPRSLWSFNTLSDSDHMSVHDLLYLVSFVR